MWFRRLAVAKDVQLSAINGSLIHALDNGGRPAKDGDVVHHPGLDPFVFPVSAGFFRYPVLLVGAWLESLDVVSVVGQLSPSNKIMSKVGQVILVYEGVDIGNHILFRLAEVWVTLPLETGVLLLFPFVGERPSGIVITIGADFLDLSRGLVRVDFGSLEAWAVIEWVGHDDSSCKIYIRDCAAELPSRTADAGSSRPEPSTSSYLCIIRRSQGGQHVEPAKLSNISVYLQCLFEVAYDGRSHFDLIGDPSASSVAYKAYFTLLVHKDVDLTAWP